MRYEVQLCVCVCCCCGCFPTSFTTLPGETGTSCCSGAIPTGARHALPHAVGGPSLVNPRTRAFGAVTPTNSVKCTFHVNPPAFPATAPVPFPDPDPLMWPFPSKDGDERTIPNPGHASLGMSSANVVRRVLPVNEAWCSAWMRRVVFVFVGPREAGSVSFVSSVALSCDVC